MLAEKDLALGLLQTAVAQLLPQPLDSIPVEKLLDQLQEGQEPSQERKQPPCRGALHPSPQFPEPYPRIKPPVLPGEAKGGPEKALVALATAWAAGADAGGAGAGLGPSSGTLQSSRCCMKAPLPDRTLAAGCGGCPRDDLCQL